MYFRFLWSRCWLFIIPVQLVCHKMEQLIHFTSVFILTINDQYSHFLQNESCFTWLMNNFLNLVFLLFLLFQKEPSPCVNYLWRCFNFSTSWKNKQEKSAYLKAKRIACINVNAKLFAKTNLQNVTFTSNIHELAWKSFCFQNTLSVLLIDLGDREMQGTRRAIQLQEQVSNNWK